MNLRVGIGQNFISIRPKARRINGPIMAMNLNDEQKQKLAAWVAEGMKFSDIQNRLASELGAQLTYMEVRLLVDDLKLTPKDPEPTKSVGPIAGPAVSTAAAGKAPGAGGNAGLPESAGSRSGAGGVSVVVDELTRPGAIVSGKATFSDGQQAE